MLIGDVMGTSQRCPRDNLQRLILTPLPRQQPQGFPIVVASSVPSGEEPESNSGRKTTICRIGVFRYKEVGGAAAGREPSPALHAGWAAVNVEQPGLLLPGCGPSDDLVVMPGSFPCHAKYVLPSC